MKFKNYIETESGIKDTSTSPGTAGQLLSSTVAGTSWIDQNTISSGTSEVVDIQVKNISSANGGINLVKGDPVYIYGSVGASARLYVDLADADSTATNNLGDGKMPCVGLLDQDLSPNGEGTATVVGKLRNLITNPIDGDVPNENDTVYVKSGGGLTLTKPTGSTNLIQNVGQVGRVSTSSDGNIVVAALLRSNDVPNLPEGRIWIGDGNTIVSDTVYVDEPNNRVGIGTTSPLGAIQIGDGAASTSANEIIVLSNTTSTGGNSNLYLATGSSGTAVLGMGSTQYAVQNTAGKIKYSDIVNTFSFDTNFSTKMVINGSGNVGIGTTNPTAKTHIEQAIANGTIAYPLKVDVMPPGSNASGDGTGISFGVGNNGSNRKEQARITVKQNYYGVRPSMSFDTLDYNSPYTDFISRMLIDPQGNVGIGTDAPAGKLHVSSGTANEDCVVIIESDTDNNDETSNPRLELRQDGGAVIGRLGYRNNTNSLELINQYTEYLYLGTSNNTYLTIRPSGNVGIGTTTPSEKLVVRNGTSNTDVKILAYNSAAGTEATLKFSTIASETNYEKAAIIARNAAASFGRSDMHFALDSAEDSGNVEFSDTKMTILNGGNVGIGETNPESKLHIKTPTASSSDMLLLENYGWAANMTTGIAFKNGGNYQGQTAKIYTIMNGGGNQGGEIRFATLAYSGINPNPNTTLIDRMTIDDLGGVGIGTTNPLFKLDLGVNAINLNTATNKQIVLNVNGGYTGQATDQYKVIGYTGSIASNTDIFTQTSGENLKNFYTGVFGGSFFNSSRWGLVQGGSTRFCVLGGTAANGAGNVGINTTSPSEKLDVVGNIKVSGNQYFNGASIYGDGKEIIRYSDTWLRINPAQNFNNGIYCGSGLLRTDGIFQVGPSGSKFVVNSIGNVGIGTTGPNHKLEVAGNMLVGNGGSNYLYISDTGNFLYGDNIGNTIIRTVNNFRIQTGISERVRVTYTGYVGIGESAPSSKLYIKGTTSTTSSQLMRIKSSTSLPSSPGRMIEFIRSNDAVRGYISMNQYGVQYNTSSDYRLKENITPINDAVSRLKELKPNRFSWKEGPSDYKVDGFIAHELAKVIPEAVSGEKDAVDENNEPAYQGIDQAKVVPLLTAALQEAISKIEQLETRIQKLENK